MILANPNFRFRTNPFPAPLVFTIRARPICTCARPSLFPHHKLTEKPKPPNDEIRQLPETSQFPQDSDGQNFDSLDMMTATLPEQRLDKPAICSKTVNEAKTSKMKQEDDMNHKEVSDLALATFLAVSGHKLLSTPRAQYGKKAVFLFEASDKIERDTLDYYNRTAKVDPLGFAETFRNLKALIV